MKFQKNSLVLFVIMLLTGCTESEKKTVNQPEVIYSSEEEKLLNDVFLSVVGTDLYYKISDDDWQRVMEIDAVEGRDKAEAFYEKKREEDPTKLVVFTKDDFWNMYSSLNSKNIRPDKLELIKYYLTEQNFDSVNQILGTLSQPLQLSNAKLVKTGRYQIVRKQDKNSIVGEYKKYGSFNTSKVFIDKLGKKAVFIYEKDCMEGFKCAEGNIVFLVKGKDSWQISKQYALYKT